MKTLRFTQSGAGHLPAVLFLHGFMGSCADWDEIVGGLDRRFRCIAVDLPGHGASRPWAEPEAYTMEGAARALVAVLDALDIERCALVGYSMGGRLALYFALHHPERCSRLVLESASPGLKTEAEREARRGLDEARAVRLENGDFEAFLEEWYRQPLFETLSGHPELVERMIAARRKNTPAELARVLRGMGTGRQPSLWGHLAGLQVPALAVVGALDGKYVELVERMAVLTPRMRTAVIQNAGHNVHAEFPKVFQDVVREFLKHP